MWVLHSHAKLLKGEEELAEVLLARAFQVGSSWGGEHNRRVYMRITFLEELLDEDGGEDRWEVVV